MRKFILTIFALLFMAASSMAADIEVLPTMQTKTNVQDRVWVGTFQIVWNDFMNKIAFTQIKFPAGTPVIVNELNKQNFTVDELSEKCYYKYVGHIKNNTKRSITKAIKRKFGETSDILSKLDLTPGKDRFLVYAMLKKDFKFIAPFDKLGVSNFRGQNAEYFGIKSSSKKHLDDMVKVLFYNNDSDLAVKIDTDGRDEVFLYKTSNTNTFNYLYADMLKKQEQYAGDSVFNKADELKVPNLKFSEEKEFKEIGGNRVKGTNIVIDKAVESIKFKMDNTGVKLKSEAGMTATMTSLRPAEESRYFYFDDTFVLFLKEKGKQKPYFALRVHDISKFQ